MAHVFKKSIVRYLDANGKQVKKGTPGAKKHKEKSAKWYGRVPGAAKPVPLCANKTAAQMMLNELVKKAEMARAGISDPYETHRKRPLSEHLDDFRREMDSKGDDPRHVSIVASRLKALLDGCGFVFIADLSASHIMDWLANLRRDRPLAPLPPGMEWFTPREAAGLLGIKTASVGAAVRRQRLAAVGQGKARRFPRATIKTLQERFSRGASIETTNQYLTHIKAFTRWLVRDHRTGADPLTHLESGNSQTDRRHDRRELEAEELRSLLTAASASERSYRGLTGWDRFHLYATACGTGFRASALASLTPASFDLDGQTPTVTLAAKRNKSRVLKVQPIPPDVAELLRDYLDGKPSGSPVWGGSWAKEGRGAEMLRSDLEAAGIPYTVEGADGPLFADFHALRHTYLTLGGRAGIDLRTLQELAGHSSPNLTARYSHRRLYDLDGAVKKLPNFLPTDEPEKVAGVLKATGTDNASAPVDASCSPVAQLIDSRCVRLLDVDGDDKRGAKEADTKKSLDFQGFANGCDGLMVVEERVGDGTRTRDFQSHSLTL